MRTAMRYGRRRGKKPTSAGSTARGRWGAPRMAKSSASASSTDGSGRPSSLSATCGLSSMRRRRYRLDQYREAKAERHTAGARALRNLPQPSRRPSGDRFLLGTEWALRLFDGEGREIWKVATPEV